MKAALLALLLLASPSLQACVVHVPPPDPVYVMEGINPPPEYAPFEEPLSSYGRWFVYDGYGWVWTPTVVSSDWRPYTVGRWVWTDEGWMWLSDEPWGWATFHYGRWFYDGAYGWIWLPDSVWGPAWVCWRTGPAFYGWAPLPPGVVFGASISSCDPWIGSWVFVSGDGFLAPGIHHHVVPPARNVYVYERTRPEVQTSTSRTPLDVRGPDPGDVSARTGTTVPRLSIDALRREPTRRPAPDAVDGDRVRITRPEFPRDLPPTRVEPGPGSRRLEEPPLAGSHRPEVPSVSPPPREIPPRDRGPKVPSGARPVKPPDPDKKSDAKPKKDRD